MAPKILAYNLTETFIMVGMIHNRFTTAGIGVEMATIFTSIINGGTFLIIKDMYNNNQLILIYLLVFI